MLKKVVTFLVLFATCSLMVFAQESTILKPFGTTYISKSGKAPEVIYERNNKTKGVNQTYHSIAPVNIKGIQGVIDTLTYRRIHPEAFTSRFGLFGGDYMVSWFEAEADLIIKAVGASFGDNDGNVGASFKIYKVGNGITKEQLLNVTVPKKQGTFKSAVPYSLGYVGFEDESDGSGYINVGTLPAFPFAEDIWSDAGFGFPLTPVVSTSTDPVLQFVETSGLGFEPTVAAGEMFAIVFKNEEAAFNVNRIGIWAWPAGSSDNKLWKFYVHGQVDGDSSTAYWLSREFVLDMAAIVDFTGDRAPVIQSFTNLPTTLSTTDRVVDAVITDDNPSGGAAGVTSAVLRWSVDNGTSWNDVNMTKGSGDNWSGTIPGQSPGTEVVYYIVATDNSSLSSESQKIEYLIFEPTEGVNTLLVFNGLTGNIAGYPMGYYFGSGDWPNSFARYAFDRDTWVYGALSAELVNNYTNIIEITADGPSDINSAVIRTWLEGGANRNYMLAGDEWLGSQTGWVNTTYAAGTFQLDILGIAADFNDVNYAATGDQALPSEVMPQQGSLLGGPTFDLHAKVSTDSGWTAPVTYDPTYEISVDNWLDGVDFAAGVEVDMKGKGIDGAEYNIGGHRTLSAGNKIAFFAFDPLALSSDTENEVQYFWYGFMDSSPQRQVLTWFGIGPSAVRETGDGIPNKFALSQNYPNPFNPSTKIKFSIPEAGFVTLNVYNLLGEKVATLVNEELKSSTYEVDFNASNLSSGLYLYTISTDKFTSTKKMMLLK